MDQEGGQRIEEEREDGGGKGQRDDEKAHPGDDEQVGDQSNG